MTVFERSCADPIASLSALLVRCHFVDSLGTVEDSGFFSESLNPDPMCAWMSVGNTVATLVSTLSDGLLDVETRLRYHSSDG